MLTFFRKLFCGPASEPDTHIPLVQMRNAPDASNSRPSVVEVMNQMSREKSYLLLDSCPNVQNGITENDENINVMCLVPVTRWSAEEMESGSNCPNMSLLRDRNGVAHFHPMQDIPPKTKIQLVDFGPCFAIR